MIENREIIQTKFFNSTEDMNDFLLDMSPDDIVDIKFSSTVDNNDYLVIFKCYRKEEE